MALVDDPIIRPKELHRMMGVSRQTIDRMIKRGEFPAARKLSPKLRGWPESIIKQWREARDQEAEQK